MFFVQLFFDDSIRNIQTGKAMGLHTVLVRTGQNFEQTSLNQHGLSLKIYMHV